MTGRLVTVLAVAAIAAGATLMGAAANARPDCPGDHDTPPLPAGWTIEVDCGDSTVAGIADLETRQITVWPAANTNNAAVARTRWHEAGHALEHEYMTASERLTFKGWRGHADDEPWHYEWDGVHVDHDEWADAPAEDFARVFVVCLRPDLPVPGDLTPPDERVCALVAGLVEREGTP